MPYHLAQSFSHLSFDELCISPDVILKDLSSLHLLHLILILLYFFILLVAVFLQILESGLQILDSIVSCI